MKVTETVQINAADSKIWDTLKSIQNSEKYIPAVQSSTVNGSGQGATRTCQVQMGDKSFAVNETLQKVDESTKSLTISLDQAPPGMQGLQFQYVVNPAEQNSTLEISTEIPDNPEMEQMIRGLFSMMGKGIKQFHE
jgi:carbon monoxide dehydrogenase subunit G